MSTLPPATLLSDVDSERFGLRIGRGALIDHQALAPLLATARGERLDMLILRCRTEDHETVHGVEAAGGRLMDTLVYHKRNLRRGEAPAELRPNAIRPLQDNDLSGMPELAREIFRGYRGHYHADPALDRRSCDEGYVDWATRMCTHRDANNEVLVVDDLAGHVCGFATVRLNTPQEGEGVLFGVAPAAEGRGVYWSLMVHAMRWIQARGATTMIVSTQITNLAVQKVWSRLGFELQRSYYTFHLWLQR